MAAAVDRVAEEEDHLVANPETSKPMLRLRHIVKTYTLGNQEVHALDDVGLDIQTGEFVAIVGPSGSGKSTLMHIIGCLDVATSGSYQFDEIEVANMDEYELAHIRNEKIGFVFQGFNLLSRTSALENVKLPLIYGKQDNQDARAVAALQRVGLGDRLDHNPNELSGGQQQRVAIARAIATNPRLILADEPTGNLASAQSEEIMEIFQELNREGATIVMVTHEPDIALHCKRIISVRDGRIIDDELVKDRLDAKVELKRMIDQRAAEDQKRAQKVVKNA